MITIDELGEVWCMKANKGGVLDEDTDTGRDGNYGTD